jgi:hypothetical protein
MEILMGVASCFLASGLNSEGLTARPLRNGAAFTSVAITAAVWSHAASAITRSFRRVSRRGSTPAYPASW